MFGVQCSVFFSLIFIWTLVIGHWSLASAEGRIYIPHLKETFVLSKILQAFFNPLSVVDVKNKDDLIAPTTTRPTFQEGQVVDNSVAPNITNYYTGSNQYNYDGQCRVENIRVNPGDDLMGPKIKANLTYTQKFEFEGIDPSTCQKDGRTSSSGNCCSKNAKQGQDEKGRTHLECTKVSDVKLDTKGRMIAGVNSPLLEELNKNLVVGDQSVFKKIYPQNLPIEIKEIPSSADYKTSEGVSKIYFPHLGTIYDYFLKGIQTALRPFIPGMFDSKTGDCNDVAAQTKVQKMCPNFGGSETLNAACIVNGELKKLIEDAANSAGIPPDILAAVVSIETRNGIFGISKDDLDKPYLCQANACGAMGVTQLLTGFGVQSSCSQASGIDNWSTYACRTDPAVIPNPGNIHDSLYAGARMIKAISGTASNINWDKDTVFRVATSYYGSCSETFDLEFFLGNANSCLTAPRFENPMSYCDYLWNYYSIRK